MIIYSEPVGGSVQPTSIEYGVQSDNVGALRELTGEQMPDFDDRVEKWKH